MASGTGIGEFFVSLTVDAAEGALTVGNLASGLSQLEVATVAEIGVLWELGMRLADIVDQSMKLALGFEQFTMHTDISAQTLQRWQTVAERSHGTAEEATKALEGLSKGMFEIGIGHPNALLKALNILNIAPRDALGNLKSADQILTDIRHHLGSIHGAVQQEGVLGMAGISPNLRESLLLNDQAFNARATVFMDADQEKKLDRLRQQFVDIGIELKKISVVIASDIAPEIGKWVGYVGELITKFEALYKLPIFQQFIKPIAQTGKALYAIAGDAMNSYVGKFDPADLAKQWKNITGANDQFWNAATGLHPSLGAQSQAARPAPSVVHIDKHDTLNFHDAHKPDKIAEVLDRHWDEIMGRRTLNPWNQLADSGGY